jgi:hypothetical protein
MRNQIKQDKELLNTSKAFHPAKIEISQNFPLLQDASLEAQQEHIKSSLSLESVSCFSILNFKLLHFT